ncbi:MAG TPA: hypothetical protein VMU69_14830 [Bradyrhizobium sp.]|nr:hypothetical protein [Bradyrhizobium sp.]
MSNAASMSARWSSLSSVGGWIVALAWPLIGGVILGMSIALFVSEPAWHDPTWYLYGARRMLDGAAIYRTEIVDVNPPLIIWLSAIPVVLGHVLGITSFVALKAILAALIAGSIVWCLSIVYRLQTIKSNLFVWWLGIALVAVFAGRLPAAEFVFAQREHFLAALILPYVFLAAARLGGRTVPRLEAILIGAAAALGVCLKPYDLLIVLALEAVIAWRLRKFNNFVRPELVALALVGLAYVGAVLIFMPDYIFKIAPLARDGYLDWARVPLSRTVTLSHLLKLIALTVVYIAAFRRLRYESLVTVLLFGGYGALGAYLLQHKDFPYQLLPELILTTLAASVIVIDILLQVLDAWGIPLQRPKKLAAGVAFVSCVVAAFAFNSILRARLAPGFAAEKTYRSVTADLPPGSAFYEMSPIGDPYVFSAAMKNRFMWGSRFAHLWMMETILQSEVGHEGGPEHEARAARLADYVRNSIVDDFERWHPAAVFVERCADTSIAPCLSLEAFRVDLLNWFLRDPRFAQIWSNYKFRAHVERYDVYMRDNPRR